MAEIGSKEVPVSKKARLNTDVDEEVSLNDILIKLPSSEVSRLIFGRLDLESKKAARSVSKLWNDLVQPTVEFCPLLYDWSEDEILTLGSKGVVIGKLTVSKLLDFTYPQEGLGFSSVRQVKLVPCRIGDDLYGISEDNFTKLLENYPDIERLALHSKALQHIHSPFLATVRLDCLQRIDISTFDGDENGFEISGHILKNHFPSLNTADIRIMIRPDSLDHMPTFYEECYRFLANHASTLTTVILHHTNLSDDRTLTHFELDQDHGIPEADYLDVLSKIENVNKLSSLDFQLTFFEGRSRFQFGIQLLNAQTNLTSLNISNIGTPNIAVWNVLPNVIEKCAKTLEHIKLSGCFCPDDFDDVQNFSGQCVKSCCRLLVLKTKICGLNINDIHYFPKQIQELSLGQQLTQDQIDFIADNMKDLVELQLSQGMASLIGSNIPKVNIGTFRKLLKLPKLVRLKLSKKNSSFKMIKNTVDLIPAIEAAPVDSLGQVLYTIDRSKFDLSSLETKSKR